MVALTFDDGPGPYTTLAVKKLRQHHLRATFFLVGKQIVAHPGLAYGEASRGGRRSHHDPSFFARAPACRDGARDSRR
ncbi:MAG: polysaccharide deacetylase family protein [Solirubrobacteraceae bacterium]